MSRLLCCLCAPKPAPAPAPAHADAQAMGAALSHPQVGEGCDVVVVAQPPTMADVIRERKKKAGGAALGTLRRRLAAATRRPRDHRPDRGCEHARFIRSIVSTWRLAEVRVLCEELEAMAALRDLVTQAELAREPAPQLSHDLAKARQDRRWCDVELVGAGWSLAAHRCVLAARCSYFRDLLARYPSSATSISLEGQGAALSRAEAELAVSAIYAGAAPCRPKWERGLGSENDLDIINVENIAACRSTSSLCSCGVQRDSNLVRRLGATLGFSLDTLQRDMKYLLDSGEYADARLVFVAEGSPGSFGFRHSELPCHRAVLAARSRFFRSAMVRRARGSGAGGGGGAAGEDGAVLVDERVLPRRFARALLHAAYTDQVDLTLIGRNTSSPSSTNSASSSSNAWTGAIRSGGSGAGAGAGAGAAAAAGRACVLDDAFQLYEIARFLEMPIVVQGCEDAVVEALSPETLPHILRWAGHSHASQWVMRQAMRYLRDELPSCLAATASARLPLACLSAALASPFLQASEAQALRALLRWAERSGLAPKHAHDREPNVVWHTAHSVSRRGGRRRSASDAALRELLAPLLQHVRVEHLPPDNEHLLQAVRRGIIPAPPALGEQGSLADAWLGRGPHRPPRCFLPYLDELKALLEHQPVPEAEVARERRARYLHRIPDTLYMVREARSTSAPPCPAPSTCTDACVSPRVLASLRARARELRGSATAVRARGMPGQDTAGVARQIALRAVREMSLPDACAELLLSEQDGNSESGTDLSPREAEPERADARDQPWPGGDLPADCCRTLSSSGSLRCASSSSRSTQPSLHISIDGNRSGSCRRELPARPLDSLSRQSVTPLRLSACVPDVAMAPNANTHLLTARDYFRHPPPEYGAAVLQLDLGDGATHTPRPGSRAQRAAHQHERVLQQRSSQLLACARPRPDEDELRAAIELSVMRAYSMAPANANPLLTGARRAGAGAGSLGGSGSLGGPGGSSTHTLPHCFRPDFRPASYSQALGTASPPQPATAPPAPFAPHASSHLLAVSSRRSLASLASGSSLGSVGSRSPSPAGSPRRRHDTFRRHDHR